MKQSKENIEYESVKIKKALVNRVRSHKELTGVSISAFFEKAAEDKLTSGTTAYQNAMTTYLMKESNRKKK
jgi:hypothetical protein